ncbi:MAG: YchJ family metal-binding protein [Rhodoglobus sp.]|uniref:YchJ family protein n=1 Tax=uncultured Salinibacterium sp. TaxID=459274 RepID=UPI0030DA5583|tara:strand:+ start:2282 stop:2653 length:372 start_codon:yes stop_codon:yes gene_type:complete
MNPCPCQSAELYDDCCARFHRGETLAPTAERLMRSRYSAYALNLADYLMSTWHSSTRPKMLELDADVRWFRLDIVSRTKGSMFDTTGTVEFRAHYRLDGAADQQHENSRFVRESGAWLYVDAV